MPCWSAACSACAAQAACRWAAWQTAPRPGWPSAFASAARLAAGAGRPPRATERLPLYCTTHPSNAIEMIADSAMPESAEGTFASNSEPAPVVLEDWLEPLRCGPDGLPVARCDAVPPAAGRPQGHGARRCAARALGAQPGRRRQRCPGARPAGGARCHAALHAPAPDSARATLVHLLQVWREGMQAPLPFALRSALVWVDGGDAAGTYEGDSTWKAKAPSPAWRGSTPTTRR